MLCYRVTLFYLTGNVNILNNCIDRIAFIDRFILIISLAVRKEMKINMSKVTMDSIAAELGISKNTVSRALRGLSGVSDTVRRKIITQAENSGYKMRSKPTAMLQITMVHDRSLRDDNFFWPSVLSGIMNYAADQGISLRAVTVESGKDNRNAILSIKNQKCDGLLVVNDIDENFLKNLSESKLPMVIADYYNETIDCDYVISANRNGIYKALTYLVSCNHKKIGFLGNKNWRFSYQARYDAFCYYMNMYDLPIDDKNVWLDPGYSDYEYLRNKIRQNIKTDDAATAWICINDVMAVDLITVLKEEGFNIPDDVSIVGFDNTTNPGTQSLTTLEVQVKALGQRAIEQLIRRIESPEKPYETLSVNTNLIIRDSVKRL